MYVIILVRMLIYWFPKMTVAIQCKAATYSVQGQVLKNHTIKAGHAQLIEDCIIQCMEHHGCHSSNFYRKKKLCELNDKTHVSHPEDMKQVPFTNYMENTGRPLTCNKNSDCGSDLICHPSLKCGECRGQALGMENNVLPDSAVTASSVAGRGHEPWRARLNNVPSDHVGCWAAASNLAGQWLQIDLGEETVVTKLATQGRPSLSQWVKSYKILFSSDGAKWEEYKVNDTVKVFAANTDQNTIVPHVLTARFTARYVRFVVMTWNNHISMRAELYGCAIAGP